VIEYNCAPLLGTNRLLVRFGAAKKRIKKLDEARVVG